LGVLFLGGFWFFLGFVVFLGLGCGLVVGWWGVGFFGVGGGWFGGGWLGGGWLFFWVVCLLGVVFFLALREEEVVAGASRGLCPYRRLILPFQPLTAPAFFPPSSRHFFSDLGSPFPPARPRVSGIQRVDATRCFPRFDAHRSGGLYSSC